MFKNKLSSPNKKMQIYFFISSLIFIILNITIFFLINSMHDFNTLIFILALNLLLLGFIYLIFILPYTKIIFYIYKNQDLTNTTKSFHIISNSIINTYYENEKKQMKLIEELQQKNEQIRQNERITRGMMNITSEILSCGNIDILLQKVLEKALELIPNAQKGSILILEDGLLHFRACIGYDYEILKRVRLRLEETFQYKCDGLFEPCIVQNVTEFNETNLPDEKIEILKENNSMDLASVLSCSILIQGKIYGTINLDNVNDIDAFCENDKFLIKHLADQIGIALNNALLLDEILNISRFDGLTKAYNRKFFEELLNKNYELAKRYNQFFTVCMIDLNSLKLVNDTYGHSAGDQLLVHFSNTVNQNIRTTDLFARMGGDEFCIVFLNATAKQAKLIINKIRNLLEQNYINYNGLNHTVTFGCGIAEYPNDNKELETLLKIADDKMYIDKKMIKGI